MPKAKNEINISSFYTPDFEKMKNDGVDAIELHLSEDKSENYFEGLYYTLYGWDCDCILILNKYIVVEKDE